jgi:hypothetical protein
MEDSPRRQPWEPSHQRDKPRQGRQKSDPEPQASRSAIFSLSAGCGGEGWGEVADPVATFHDSTI